MSRQSLLLGRWTLIVVLVLAVGVSAAWYAVARSNKTETPSGEAPRAADSKSTRAVSVEVVFPQSGGIDRLSTQPGSFEPIQAANIYAKVSGYLIEQTVDIGSQVKAGDILAKIAMPEQVQQVAQDTADLDRAKAKVDQMTVAVATAEADSKAATAAVAFALAEVKSKTSYRKFREKQRDRIRELASRNSIDRKLEDEQENQYQASVSAELAALEAVNAAQQKEAAARSRVKQAGADVKYARAEVEVAKAKLARAQVLLDYATIRSPYTGTVTRRNFQPGLDGRNGDFIRSPSQGGEIPLLSVERTDVMRLVVQVPEREAPFVEVGDQAVVQVDAFPGLVFQSDANQRVDVSRLAKSEDPLTRMMRVEIDMKNKDGRFRRGMYARVTLTLQTGAKSAVRVPSSALVENSSVRVVRDDVAQIVPVVRGLDNGKEVEIISGLKTTDQVIVRASSPVTNGTPVAIGKGK